MIESGADRRITVSTASAQTLIAAGHTVVATADVGA
jgi:hypothetical protein